MTRAIFIERGCCDRLQEKAPISTPISRANIAARATRKTMQVSEDEEGIARQSEQPELAVRDYEENCASHSLDGRSD